MALKLTEGQTYLCIAAISLLVSAIWIVVLPLLGILKFQVLSSPLILCLLSGGVLGLCIYIAYLKFILKDQARLFILYVLSIDLFNFIFRTTENTLGISLKVTTLTNLIYMVPLVLLILQPPQKNWWRIPLSVYMTAFLIVNIIYFIFYNHNAVDLLFKTAGEYVPLAWARVVSVLNIAILLVGTTKFLQSIPRPERFFDTFNKYYLLTIMIFSVLGIVFYPFDLLTVVIETKRMALFFAHPNAYSHYLSLAICFLLGSAFYYLKKNQGMKAKIIFFCVPFMFIALSLAGSKTSLIVSAISIMIILVLEGVFNKQKFSFLTNPKMLLLLGFIFALIVGLASSFGVLDSFQQRFSDDGSASWRFKQWQRVIDSADPDKWLFGHGHTAGILVTQRYVYNTWNMSKNIQESPYIHNALIEHFYDYGILGLLWIVGFAHCMIYHLSALFSKNMHARFRSIHISSIALVFVQLVGLLFNESFYLPSPLSVWFLWAIQYFIATIPQYQTEATPCLVNKEAYA